MGLLLILFEWNIINPPNKIYRKSQLFSQLLFALSNSRCFLRHGIYNILLKFRPLLAYCNNRQKKGFWWYFFNPIISLWFKTASGHYFWAIQNLNEFVATKAGLARAKLLYISRALSNFHGTEYEIWAGWANYEQILMAFFFMFSWTIFF